MAKPVNAMTGDAPDGQNPNKKYVPEKQGRFKYTPPPPPKPDPRDAEIFTEEKLRRSGGKMKEPPMGLDSKKRGGVIKRRFASGGEIMDEYDGAIGRGTDTPDKKIAREKSDAAYESDAADKAAGLKASKDEPVGFFKRLMMGNIDKPGSEAYEKLGAGRGKAARESAAEAARESGQTAERYKPAAVESEKPVAPVASKPDKYSDSGDNGDVGTIEYSPVNKPTVKPTVRPTISSSDRSMPSVSAGNPRDAEKGMSRGRRDTDTRNAEQGMSRGTRNTNIDMAEGPTYNGPRTGPEKKAAAVKAKIPTSAASKAPVSTKESTSGPSNIERILMATGVGAGIGALGVGGAMGVKAYKAAQRAKELDAAKRFSQTGAKEVAKDISKYTPKQELEAGTSAIRGSVTRRGIREERSRAEAGAPKGTSFMEKAASNKRGTSYKDDMKKGGSIKAYASGGSISASSRGDGCAQRGKTRGMMR
jgi:hypothetical protein